MDDIGECDMMPYLDNGCVVSYNYSINLLTTATARCYLYFVRTAERKPFFIKDCIVHTDVNLTSEPESNE